MRFSECTKSSESLRYSSFPSTYLSISSSVKHQESEWERKSGGGRDSHDALEVETMEEAEILAIRMTAPIHPRRHEGEVDGRDDDGS